MTTAARTLSNRRPQYVILALLSIGVCGLAGLLELSRSRAFRPFFSDVNPLLATVLVTALAATSLVFLASGGWFDVCRQGAQRRGLLVAAAVATLLAVPTILVDVIVVFPANMNVAPPQSFFFYPVMGYVAETVFHLVPVSLLLIVLPFAFRHVSREAVLWSCVILASLLEPLFQLTWAPAERQPAWANAYVALHVYVFNVLQLYVFKRFDFLSVYAFRLVYYAHWHIVWGYVRLHMLF